MMPTAADPPLHRPDGTLPNQVETIAFVEGIICPHFEIESIY